jgi:ubiquitin-activating enzyme E1
MCNNLVDIELYDRQIRTLGLEAINKLHLSSVMIIGLQKGLGTEVSKNLLLCGVKNILLFDNDNISYDDIETGYYYSNKDIDKMRADVLTQKLKELNPTININITNSYRKNQNVTIIINKNIDYIQEISNYCRIINSKLIILYSGGISGLIFVDAGPEHQINNLNEETINSIQIVNISNQGIVTCFNNHKFDSNDLIKFNKLKGFNLDNLNKEWEIEIINLNTFKLINFSCKNTFKFINGNAINIKKSIIINHNTFESELLKYNNLDLSSNDSINIIKTYLQLFNKNLINKMPFIWSSENNKFMHDNKIILKDIARIFNQELISVVSIMGSIASTEIIKLITNNYTPINQWFTWYEPNLIPKSEPTDYDLSSAYSILYGKEYFQRIINSNLLIVGAGSIGCEYLKNLTFTNVKNITITDFDIIKKSNLNTQFLFKEENINKFKSETAKDSIQRLKPNINITTFTEAISSKNINFVNDIFNNNFTCVFTAVDNIESRKFTDEQCFKNDIPLFDSGTYGMKGSTQSIIPFITETYSSSHDPDNIKTFLPCLTINFPNEINHVVSWARDQFDIFTKFPNILNDWLNNTNYLKYLSQNDKSIAINYINIFMIKYQLYKKNINEYFKYAIDIFIKNFYIDINKLLNIYPIDHELEPNVLFWSNGKICPRPIEFDPLNKIHISFIESTINILLDIFKFNISININDYMLVITDYVKTINYNSFNFSFDTNEELNNISEIEQFLINSKINIEINNISENNMIKWLITATNVRSDNYDISYENQFEIKGIVEKIIPAILPVSSLVVGISTIEFLKLLYNIKTFKSTFINLVDTNIIYYDPKIAPIIEVNGIKINSWEKFEYKNLNATLKDFKNYYELLFKTHISMIVLDTSILYADFNLSNLENKICNLIINKTNNNSNRIILTILSEDDDIVLPEITVIL